MSNRETGERGEELALRHLEGKGYDALERNYRTRYGEIDLVVRRGATLVFVEVKGARVALRTRAARAQGLREARRGRRLRENSAVIGQSVGRLWSRYLELRKEISAGAHAGKGRREAER